MKGIAVLFIASMAISSGAMAQNETPKAVAANAEFYRLDFVLKETESGKLISSRSFQMMVRTDEQGMSSIRSGGKVPVKNDPSGFQYIDVGVNIDVRRVSHVKDGLSLDIVAEASGAVDLGEGQSSRPGPPIVRQDKWTSNVLIPIQKPVAIFSSDSPAPKRQVQLEVTATPVR